jgi:hypothetical protein
MFELLKIENKEHKVARQADEMGFSFTDVLMDIGLA